MIVWRLFLGIVLFACSGFIGGYLADTFDWQFIVADTDYASAIIDKILAALGGSCIIWGILKNPKQRKASY